MGELLKKMKKRIPVFEYTKENVESVSRCLTQILNESSIEHRMYDKDDQKTFSTSF